MRSVRRLWSTAVLSVARRYFFRDSAAPVLRRRERNARRPFTPLSWRSVVVKTEQKRRVRIRYGRRSLFQRRQ